MSFAQRMRNATEVPHDRLAVRVVVSILLRWERMADAALLDDLLQEGREAVLRCAPLYQSWAARPENAGVAIATYLASCVRNAIFDYLKRLAPVSGKDPPSSAEQVPHDVPSGAPSPEEQVECAQLVGLIRARLLLLAATRRSRKRRKILASLVDAAGGAAEAGTGHDQRMMRYLARRDPVIAALAAENGSATLRQTRGEQRRAVEELLRDDAWALRSDYQIAARCGVSRAYVWKVRQAVGGRSPFARETQAA